MGKMAPCDACLRAKAQAKNTKKSTECVATNAGERLYLDTMGPYLDTMGPFEPSLGGSCYDMKMVDQSSCKSWDGHMKSKDQVDNLLKTHLNVLQGKGITVKYLRCNNAGKQGGRLADLCRAHRITMEYTAPYMPQQNRVVEWKIATDCNCAYAMLLAAWLTKQARHLLRVEAESTATKLSNLVWNQQVKGVPNSI